MFLLLSINFVDFQRKSLCLAYNFRSQNCYVCFTVSRDTYKLFVTVGLLFYLFTFNCIPAPIVSNYSIGPQVPTNSTINSQLRYHSSLFSDPPGYSWNPWYSYYELVLGRLLHVTHYKDYFLLSVLQHDHGDTLCLVYWWILGNCLVECLENNGHLMNVCQTNVNCRDHSTLFP